MWAVNIAQIAASSRPAASFSGLGSDPAQTLLRQGDRLQGDRLQGDRLQGLWKINFLVSCKLQIQILFSNSLPDFTYSRNTSSATLHYLMSGSFGHVVDIENLGHKTGHDTGPVLGEIQY